MERNVSQPVPAHAGAFATIAADENELFAFADKNGAGGSFKVSKIGGAGDAMAPVQSAYQYPPAMAQAAATELGEEEDEEELAVAGPEGANEEEKQSLVDEVEELRLSFKEYRDTLHEERSIPSKMRKMMKTEDGGEAIIQSILDGSVVWDDDTEAGSTTTVSSLVAVMRY